mmetsp:Transcript_39121/g.63981  ORF Transcript_39121/g.63981 Transcript_39121/m.63981 type:complete len:227 (-) Transcript_39121:727-1407(-)
MFSGFIFIGRRWSHKRYKLHARHIWLQHVRHHNSIFRLIVFENGANSACGRHQSGIQHVSILLLFRLLLIEAVACLHRNRLIVGAIGGRHQFTIALQCREPAFQIIFFRRGIIQMSRHDAHHSIAETERLIKCFRRGQHFVVMRPTLARFAIHKLLDFVKLMHSENAPRIFAMRASLFTEAGRDTRVFDRQVGGLQPLFVMHGRNGLLRGRNQVFRRVHALASHMI